MTWGWNFETVRLVLDVLKIITGLITIPWSIWIIWDI